jgi:phage-related minor tail protein
MAMNMDALLRIATKVTGAEQVTALQGKFKQVEGAAHNLTSRIGPLSGALSALAPVATVGGLAALVGKTIETGDALNDMSQRTGVSVEALAKFKKAAATSGTDIDTVASSLVKLSKGLFNIGGRGDKVGPALERLGISAKDAAGNLKTADQITLEVANAFKAMPDGVEKTATALDLFGKAGANMIPMLNEGGTAIEALSVKMTGAFAKKADEYNDKLAALGGKVGGLAAGITVALLPALDAVATVLTVMIDGFSNLPGPIQAIVGGLALLAISFTVLAPIAASVVTVLGAFQGLAIGATIAGWLGALGPLAAGLATFATAIVGWPLLIGAALVAVGVLIYAFRDDIGKVVGAIGTTIRDGMGAVWDWVKSSISSVASALVAPFETAAGAIKNVLRSVLQFGANVINGFLGAINQMINAVNGIAGRLNLPTLPTFGAVSVPSFEGGGYTGNAPRSGGIDGRGGFMAMLHPRETVIDHARAGGGGVPNITIKTGPIYQLSDGTDTVSMRDFEAGLQSLATGIMAAMGSPAGRVALGGA